MINPLALMRRQTNEGQRTKRKTAKLRPFFFLCNLGTQWIIYTLYTLHTHYTSIRLLRGIIFKKNYYIKININLNSSVINFGNQNLVLKRAKTSLKFALCKYRDLSLSSSKNQIKEN